MQVAIVQYVKAGQGIRVTASKSRNWPAGCPSVSQLRAARVLSGWGMRELAAASELSPTSVCQIENRVNELPRKPTLEAMRRALEGRGIEFGSDGWVRLADDQGMAVEGAASLTADACARALEYVERARRVLRRACAGSHAVIDGERGRE